MGLKVDTTLRRLSHGELARLRDMMVEAICDQPPHDTPPHKAHRFVPELGVCAECLGMEDDLVHVPEFDAEMAYELSCLNWDICNDLAGRAHLFDEWFSGIPV